MESDLSALEVCRNARLVSKKFRLEKLHYWHARIRLVQFKVKRPTMCESARLASSNNNLIKFCNNMISAHRTAAFGGMDGLWDFFKDVAANLNKKDSGHRYNDNTKCFSQAMRVYGGRRLCDLFSLNFARPSFDTIRRDNRKGVMFMSGEHAEIFESIASIYVDAKSLHGISGPILVILAEDETRVRSRVSYEARWDIMVGFCGSKNNHSCVIDYKPTVRVGDAGYSHMIDAFRANKVGGFARVIVVNPLYEKLPRLVLAACYTCGCFDSGWLRAQWSKIDSLWKKHYYTKVKPILGHALVDDNSCWRTTKV